MRWGPAALPLTPATPSLLEGKRTVPNPLHRNHNSNQPKEKEIETTEQLLREDTTSDMGGIVVEEHIVQDNPFNNYDDDEDGDESVVEITNHREINISNERRDKEKRQLLQNIDLNSCVEIRPSQLDGIGIFANREIDLHLEHSNLFSKIVSRWT